MPHFIVEYSSNLDQQVDLPQLGRTLRDSAVATGVFPLGGIRVRMYRADVYEIADGRPDAAFVHIMLRIGKGRDLKTRMDAGEAVFTDITDFFANQFDERPFALSFEIVEIDADTTFKKNNIHQYLTKT